MCFSLFCMFKLKCNWSVISMCIHNTFSCTNGVCNYLFKLYILHVLYFCNKTGTNTEIGEFSLNNHVYVTYVYFMFVSYKL